MGGAGNRWMGLETDGWGRKQVSGAGNRWLGLESGGWGMRTNPRFL